jgi:hypothetical protein
MLNVIAEVMSNIDPKHKLDKIGGDTIIEQPKMPAHIIPLVHFANVL